MDDNQRSRIIAEITDNVKTNGRQMITGQLLQDVLLYIIDRIWTGDESQEAINEAISGLTTFHCKIVAELPSVGEENVLYLVGPTGSGSDRYEEWIYYKDPEYQYSQPEWVKIGDTSIDMSDYAKKEDVPFEKGTGSGSAKLKSGGSSASGNFAVAEGDQTSASGFASHAEGGYDDGLSDGSTAEGNYSHAEGLATHAAAEASHAEGKITSANSNYSHAEGESTVAGDAEDSENTSSAHAEGFRTYAAGRASHTEGGGVDYDAEDIDIPVIAYGDYSHAEGRSTTAEGEGSHAEGRLTIASGNYSHAEGGGLSVDEASDVINVTASGNYSHAEGNITKSAGLASHAEGYNSETGGSATSNAKTAGSSTAAGSYAHAEGNSTIAKGVGSHAEGEKTFAAGKDSHAEGYFTKTSNDYEHAEGKFNKTNTNTIHSVGVGTGDSARVNAIEVMNTGDVYVKGVGGYDGTNPGGTGIKTLVGALTDLEGPFDKGTGTSSAVLKGSSGTAAGNYSVSAGNGTQTTNAGEHAEGKFNKSNTGTISSVGVGTNAANRANAVEVMDTGDVYIKGLGGYDGTNPGASGVVPVNNIFNTGSSGVSKPRQIIALTQADYNALQTHDANTIYFIL